MKNFIQINILIKRILYRPAMIAVLMLIPVSIVSVRFLPEKKQSTEIVSGIFIEKPDSYTDTFIDSLEDTSTGFIFQIYSSLDEMMDDVASEKLDSGYSLPSDFSTSMINCDDSIQINVYTTAGTSFYSVTSESVYSALLTAYAADMSVNMLERRYISDALSSDTDSYIKDFIRQRFHGYIENDDIFSINGSLNGKYVSQDKIVPNNFPVELLIYITIFICALLGTQNYLKDLDGGVYSMLPKSGKIGFCIKNIAAGIIPAAILSVLSLIIYMDISHTSYILIHVAAISIMSLAASMITGLLLRRYRSFTIAMPFIIICTLLPLLLSQLSQM